MKKINRSKECEKPILINVQKTFGEIPHKKVQQIENVKNWFWWMFETIVLWDPI